MILNYSFAISWKTVDKNKPNVLNLYSNSLNHQFVVSVSVRKTITPLITVCTENSLFAQVLAHLQCWLLVRFFSEQLKWSMEPVGTGCQDIPGIWLSIRQLGWVAKLFVPQMADQYNWLPTPLAWRCHRVSSPFPVESVFYAVCVCVWRCVFVFGGLGWNMQQVTVSMFVWCLTWIMYERMKVWWSTRRQSVCTHSFAQSTRGAYLRCSRSWRVCWKMTGKATAGPALICIPSLSVDWIGLKQTRLRVWLCAGWVSEESPSVSLSPL